MNGQVFYVNSNTNFVSLNDGQAMVQIASNSPYPGPNGLGGITVQGSASNIQTKQDDKGNVYLNMNVQGVFISATVSLMLTNGTNNATVTVDQMGIRDSLWAIDETPTPIREPNL